MTVKTAPSIAALPGGSLREWALDAIPGRAKLTAP